MGLLRHGLALPRLCLVDPRRAGALPALPPLTACQTQLLQFGNGTAAISPHAVTKVSLTITHRVFQPKVMQRTDCGLMRVLFAP